MEIRYLIDTDWVINCLALLTNHRRHFQRIEGLTLLSA